MPRAVFLFPAASGHVNPSLPLSRGLVNLGWNVDYLAIQSFKEAIEDTGATFFDRDQVFEDHGISNITEVVLSTFEEYKEKDAQQWALNFGNIATQRLFPIYTNWFQSRDAQLIVYCPVLCQVARFVSMKLQIPAVSLLTAAGPGFFDAAFASHIGNVDAVRGAVAALVAKIKANEPNNKAIEYLRTELDAPQLTLNTAEPLLFDYYTEVNLVSTTIELADPMCEADEESYHNAGKIFKFVGPLLDVSGAKRAFGGTNNEPEKSQIELMERVKGAMENGCKIIYVSMGTVLTSDNVDHGWNATSGSIFSGRELCQLVYQSVFEELGTKENEKNDYFIVVSIGNQKNAIDGLTVPCNAICAPRVPQVDLLRTGKPALFVTNGGQNSIMESMTAGTPVVVCPGFGDQITNAAKVVAQGWGWKVDRPKEGSVSPDDVPGAKEDYQASVREAIRKSLASKDFVAKSQKLAEGLKRAEGVEGALRILINASGHK